MNNNRTNIIFDSNSNKKEYFVISLDHYKLYYNDKMGINSNNIPNFSIIFDPNFQCFHGTETCPNGNIVNIQSLNINPNSMINMPNVGHEMNNDQDSLYKLSGKNQFNVQYFEIFEIEMKISS